LAHPIVFLKADGYRSDDIKSMIVYPFATALALKRRGCVQGFNKIVDSPKVRDGDIFVYAGNDSLKEAKTLQDMFDIEILSYKELREKVEV